MSEREIIEAYTTGSRDGASQRYSCQDKRLQKPSIANLGGMAIEWVMGSLTLLGSIARSMLRIAEALEVIAEKHKAK